MSCHCVVGKLLLAIDLEEDPCTPMQDVYGGDKKHAMKRDETYNSTHKH